MTLDQIITYLETLPLADALWWFIENVDSEHANRTDIFFYLRGRVRVQS